MAKAIISHRTGKGSLGALAGVMGLDAHANLDNAPAQDDDADGLMILKMKSERLLTIVNGSEPAAMAGTVQSVRPAS